MTEREAQQVAAILATADGGCSNCVERLVELMRRRFPGFSWTYDGIDGDGTIVVKETAK